MPFFVRDRHKLFYRKQGDGPLMLVLPGNTASSACHAGELDYFGARYHVAALDFRGTGQSQRLDVFPDDWWEQGAHDAAALVDHLGYSSCIAMGTSGGAIVALLMAILHPERVRAVIADSTVERFPPSTLSREVQERSQETPGQVEFWRWAQGDDWHAVVQADSDFLLRFERAGGDCFHGGLKEIQCPVLLTASLEDASLPQIEAQVARMAGQIPNSQLMLAESGGHPLMWSRPDEFRCAADDFLAGLDPDLAA